MIFHPPNRFSLVLTSTALVILLPGSGIPQTRPQNADEVGLSTSQVVNRLVEKSADRANALERYQSRRSYRLDYVGFPENLHAEMIVDMSYEAPATKEFTIVSESGSKWVIHHIFKRLLESEREALDARNQERTALNNQNYDFSMLPDPGSGANCSYVLAVQPRGPGKFLYRGRIWVDATDFAVCRIEAEPAENPSVWIKKTEIHHAYLKAGDFWLPAENISVSTMRLGGVATLTIKYGDYKILESRALSETNSRRGSLTPATPKPTN
jgi:hypothetical protein